jgi:DNA polymerase III sliding clamp (beta) subunit (PCNA family)
MENTNTEAKAGNIAAAAALITVKRADLADALKALKFKQGKHAIPILNFVAADVAAGALTLKATDLQTAVTYKIKAVENTAYKGGSFCLQFSDLEAAIKGAPKKGDIELKYAAGSAAISWPELSGGSFSIHCQPSEDFPIIPDASNEKTETLRACVDYHNMQGLFNAIGFTASTEDDRHFLNGIFFDGKDAVTTDGRRLAVLSFPFTFTPKDKENGVIIPTEPIRRAAKNNAAGKLVIYSNMAYFVTPKMTIAARLVEGNFPAYKQIQPKTWESIATLDGAALLPVLSALPGINKSRSLGVTFLFTAAGYELYFKNEKIAAFPLLAGASHFKEKAFKIAFQPAFVRDILAAAPGNVQIRLNTAATPAGAYNGSGAEYIIMPLRTENAGGSLAARLEELAAAEKPAESGQDAPAEPEAPEAQEEAPAAVQDTPAPAPEPVQVQEIAEAPAVTAAPWYAKNSPSGKQGLIISEKTGETVAVVYDNKNSGPLSAALDLRDALAALLEVSGRLLPQGADADGLNNCDALANARRALQKAKGE